MKKYFECLGYGFVMCLVLVSLWGAEFIAATLFVAILKVMGIVVMLGVQDMSLEAAAVMATIAWAFTGLPFLGNLLKE